MFLLGGSMRMKMRIFFRALQRRLSNAVWWVRHRTINRFNVLKIQSLKPSYYDYDKDTIMLHACFQLLVNYVEKEKPFEWWGCDGKCNGGHYCGEGENRFYDTCYLRDVRNLYDWWTIERPRRPKPSTFQEEDAHDNEDQQKLKQLIEIRNHLWT